MAGESERIRRLEYRLRRGTVGSDGSQQPSSVGLFFVAPQVLATYAGGSRTPVPWTTVPTGLPRGSKAAYVVFRYRDKGDKPHSAGFLVRSQSGEPEYNLLEVAFSFDDEDKNGSVTAFVPLSPLRTFDFSIPGGFEDGWTIELIGGYSQ